MTVSVHLGYVPLLDAAPLIIADALGFAEEEGLRLNLHAAPSWAALRDMLSVGQVHAAQMLAPIPIAMALGLARSPVPFEALCVLNRNGNVIGVSNALAAKLLQQGYDFDFQDAKTAGLAILGMGKTLRIGVPFAFSMHAELLQYWLLSLGADQTQLDIRTVPPSQMSDALAADEIDLFCVGEPWGSVAVDVGVCRLLLPTKVIWENAPEKVLATRVGWAEREPKVAGALLRAIWRSGRWLSDLQNSAVASEVLTGPNRLAVTPEIVERALSGRIIISQDGKERQVAGFIEFHNGAAGFPWRSQAAWIGAALAQRHGLDITAASTLAATIFRSDLYRLHLRSTGAGLPGASAKLEGALSVPTPVPSERGHLILSNDQFFDARIFDPSHPLR